MAHSDEVHIAIRGVTQLWPSFTTAMGKGSAAARRQSRRTAASWPKGPYLDVEIKIGREAGVDVEIKIGREAGVETKWIKQKEVLNAI